MSEEMNMNMMINENTTTETTETFVKKPTPPKRKDFQPNCAYAECVEDGYCEWCKKRCDGTFEATGYKAQCMDGTKMCMKNYGAPGNPVIFRVTPEEIKRLIDENRVAYITLNIKQDDIAKYLTETKDGKIYKFKVFVGVAEDQRVK